VWAALYNVTVADNQSLGGPGGALFVDDGSAGLYNSIVQSNQVDCAERNFGRILTGQHNIESGVSCGFNDPTDQQNTDALLDPLADNGGPTRTRALQPGSPAIDGGNPTGCVADRDGNGVLDPNPLMGDQRSEPRTNTCDIGAFESSPAN
jgi:hypothetical protein